MITSEETQKSKKANQVKQQNMSRAKQVIESLFSKLLSPINQKRKSVSSAKKIEESGNGGVSPRSDQQSHNISTESNQDKDLMTPIVEPPNTSSDENSNGLEENISMSTDSNMYLKMNEMLGI